MRRSALRLSVVLLAAVIALTCPPAVRASVQDRDHDKIFDDLEHQLSGDRRVPVLVSLKAPATAARLAGIQSAVGSLDHPGALHIVHAFWARATPGEIRALARRPDVANVEEDAKVVPFNVSAQDAFGITQARAQIPGLDGHGEVAAVIDSGIDPAMPDLAGRIVGWHDLVNGRDTPYDDLGHGSLVSDILAGVGATGTEGRGVAPGASLVGVKVIDANAQSSLSLIAQGIQWAVDNRAKYGIDAINLSIGDPTGCGDGTDVASRAVDAAVAAGIVVVAASGNSGPASCTVKDPAAAASALTVGAMADTGVGGFSQAWFSSRGPTADGRIKPDISAPGVNVPIAQSGGGVTVGSGTSAAAPFMTGTALLMLQTNPALTPAQIKEIVERTAVDWGPPGPDDDYGAGRLDAYAALNAAGAALAVPPGEPGHLAWTGTLAQGETFQRDIDVAGSSFPLAVTMAGPPFATANFDLTLLDSDGDPVGTITPQPTASRQEDLSLVAPAPGRYTVRVTATMGGGDFNVDVSGALAPADTTPPALALDDPPATTSDATPGFAGAAGDSLGDFPGVVTTVRHGADVVRRTWAQPLLGRWAAEVSPALPDGDYTVEVEQGDAAGNVTRTPGWPFKVDTVAPGVPAIAAPADGSLQNRATVALSGTAEPTASIEVHEAGQLLDKATADGPGNWAVSLTGVTDGPHTYEIVARDAAGNASSAVRRSVTVDTTPPVVTIAAATEGHAATFRLTTSEPATIACRLDGAAWAPCDTTVTYSSLADSAHHFETQATDAAKNTGPIARWNWTVPALTPTPTPAPTPTASATPTPKPVASRPCVLRLTLPRQRLSVVRRHGLSVTVRASKNCRVRLTVKLGRTVLARRTIAAGARSRHFVIRLRDRLRPALTVTGTAPGARAVTRRITLRR